MVLQVDAFPRPQTVLWRVVGVAEEQYEASSQRSYYP
jgi:hypothetical protein